MPSSSLSSTYSSHDMLDSPIYKQYPRQFHAQLRHPQDHHNHKLSRTQVQSTPPVPLRIPRASPPSLPREVGLTHAPYGQTTMDLHKNQRSQQSHFGTNSRSARAANAATLLEIETTNMYHQVVEPDNPLCSKCHGVILVPEKLPESGLPPLMADGSWNFNYPLHQPMLQRNNSIGGFTLTGQDTRRTNKSGMSRFCSSHKIALVVSTFSFLVTIGLTVTLILMKNKGMMEPM